MATKEKAAGLRTRAAYAGYLLHLNSIPAGGFQNWRDGLGWEKWRADIGGPLTHGEGTAQRTEAEPTKRERESRDKRRRARKDSAVWLGRIPVKEHCPARAHGRRRR